MFVVYGVRLSDVNCYSNCQAVAAVDIVVAMAVDIAAMVAIVAVTARGLLRPSPRLTPAFCMVSISNCNLLSTINHKSVI